MYQQQQQQQQKPEEEQQHQQQPEEEQQQQQQQQQQRPEKEQQHQQQPEEEQQQQQKEGGRRMSAAAAARTMESVGAEELLRLTERARGLVEAGSVLAVQDVKGQSRHARISLEHGRLHLHSLQATPPPPCALILQMCEVVPAAPPCEVFLDLAWPGSAARRVVVNLPQDTPIGRQFVLLCSGQRGACYANSRLLKVWFEGEPGECLMGGDYETNNGVGGAALLPHLEAGHYWASGMAGAVWWWPWHGPSRYAQFIITTCDCRPVNGGIYGNVFGEVVRGLEVVQEAAKHDPITEVTVVQCGILLPGQ